MNPEPEDVRQLPEEQADHARLIIEMQRQNVASMRKAVAHKLRWLAQMCEQDAKALEAERRPLNEGWRGSLPHDIDRDLTELTRIESGIDIHKQYLTMLESGFPTTAERRRQLVDMLARATDQAKTVRQGSKAHEYAATRAMYANNQLTRFDERHPEVEEMYKV